MSFEHRPKCKVCGALHFARDPHQFDGNVPRVDLPSPQASMTNSRAKASEAKPTPPQPKVPAKSDRDVNRPSRSGGTPAPITEPDVTAAGTPRQRAPKGTFDRKAYQREKARQRRAAKRALAPRQ